MSDKPDGFMNMDLTKLTLVGWLMMLLTIAVVVGVAFAVGAIFRLVGLDFHTPEGAQRRWVAALCILPGIAAGGGFFEGGRRLLNRLGFPLMRGSGKDTK